MIALVPTLVFGQVQYLPEGTPAPYTGFLFTPEAESEVNDRMIDLEATKQELMITQEENVALGLRLKSWQKEAERANADMVRQERGRFWENTLYFGLGAVLTGFLAVGVSRAVK